MKLCLTHAAEGRRSVSQPSALAPANGGLAETQLPSTAVRGGQGRGQSKGLCPGHNAVAQPVKKLKAQGTVCMSAFRQFPVRFPADAPLPRELAFLTKVRTLRRRKQAAPHLLRWSRVLFAHLRKPCFGQEPAVASSAPAAGPTPVLPQEAAGGPFSMKLKGLKT